MAISNFFSASPAYRSTYYVLFLNAIVLLDLYYPCLCHSISRALHLVNMKIMTVIAFFEMIVLLDNGDSAGFIKLQVVAIVCVVLTIVGSMAYQRKLKKRDNSATGLNDHETVQKSQDQVESIEEEQKSTRRRPRTKFDVPLDVLSGNSSSS